MADLSLRRRSNSPSASARVTWTRSTARRSTPPRPRGVACPPRQAARRCRVPPSEVVAELVDDVDGGLIGSAGGRFFAWVIGGAVPSSLAADWLAVGLGPERGTVRRRARGRRRRGGRGRVAQGNSRTPRVGQLRVRDRLPDGAYHLPRGGASRRTRAPRVGRRAAGTLGRAADLASSAARSGTAPSTAPSVCSASAARASSISRPTMPAASRRSRSSARSRPAATPRRSSPCRPATSTSARTMRSTS